MRIRKIIKAEEAEEEVEHLVEETAIAKRAAGNPGSRQKIKYLDCISAFDIETTRIIEIEQSVMYVWQWAFTINDEIVVIIGRTWRELIKIWMKIVMNTLLQRGCRLVIYVHNLSYEFQFLSGIFSFVKENVFALKSRKVLKAVMLENTIELRCSYLQSNMPLSAFLKEMNVEHKKLSGDYYDYTKQRFSWTKLSEEELQYVIHDVVGLIEAIQIRMQMGNDNLYSIPLTSTGYVRRDVKKIMRPHKQYIESIHPDYKLFKLLRWAFRGGNTHANRYYANRIIENVKSADRSSSYPDVACNCQFPISKFQIIANADMDKVVENIKRGRAVVMHVAITNIRLIDDGEGNPYLSKHKCIIQNGVYDNGRVLEAEYLETAITDVDLKIILEMYEWDDIVVTEAYYSRYGKLPDALINLFTGYYHDKTALKGIEEQALNYALSKAKINSVYGLMAQNPLKGEQIYNTDYESLWEVEENETEEAFNKAIKRATLPYQWGVWVTALARYRLHEGIKLAGHGFVYADTDSVKYVGDIDWDEYNQKRIRDSLVSGAHAVDRKGKEHYMGVYEFEGIYERFCTMGAKKYAYEEDGKLHLTVSGVSKKKGADELGQIENFKPGFIFHAAGGNELIYNDHPEIDEVEIEGHRQKITRNVVIKNSTYTLGLTAEYERLIQDCSLNFNSNYGNKSLT